jgi:hypothetical protein
LTSKKRQTQNCLASKSGPPSPRVLEGSPESKYQEGGRRGEEEGGRGGGGGGGRRRRKKEEKAESPPLPHQKVVPHLQGPWKESQRVSTRKEEGGERRRERRRRMEEEDGEGRRKKRNLLPSPIKQWSPISKGPGRKPRE